ncbi:hypothetical protein G7054_g10849 [Neopestalotiopsis clavispora]|nr:hypothetical protein G7054_g10849 [Neopestalotiopsis clavispora]
MSTVSASKPIVMTDRGPSGLASSYLQQEPQPLPGMIGPTPSFPGPPSPSDLARPNRTGGAAARVAGAHGRRPQVRPDRGRELPARVRLAAAGGGRYDDPVAEDRLRRQRALAIAELRTLRSGVSALVKASESHRWGRWVLGGFFATLIPAVRRLFRRPSDDQETSNDTEYAFRKSKGLISRTWNLVRNNGALASMGLLVLSVLYVFQAEVSLRVARTVSKRLKRLIQRIEIGDEVLDEKDLHLFAGWRWRVLSWKS